MRGRVVILAAGDFPKRDGEPWRLLRSAEHVVACDSAAESFRRAFRRWPDAVVGDMDSVGRTPHCRVVKVEDQNDNDLAKAIAFCKREFPDARGIHDLVIVGATGRREDHTIGNVYRALDAEVRVATDFGEFLPVHGRRSLKTWVGSGVSVFAPDPKTKMTSRGLAWKLDGVRFANAYCATLNRASSENVTVASDRPAFIYVERNPQATRAAVSLGSNLGNRAACLRCALKALAALPHTRLVDASEVEETEGIDVPAQFAELKFLNQAALFETTLTAHEFSREMHRIEDAMGRVRTVRNGPRTIDIDLVDFGGARMEEPELTLPHPRARERAFVTNPLRSLGVEI